MVLSAALEKGYIFMALIAILTSVIGAVYYLRIIKVVFFDKDESPIKPEYIKVFKQTDEWYSKMDRSYFNTERMRKSNLFISTSLSLIVSSLTLIILLFILKPTIWLSNANILALILFNP